MYPIGRMYDTEQKAQDAVRRLQEIGVTPDRIALFTPGAGGSPEMVESGAPNLPPGHAVVYARGIAQGYSVVVVQSFFGTGESLGAVLNGFGPVDKKDLPLIRKGSSAPLSEFFGIPTLARERSTFLGRMFGPLARPDYALSNAVGMKMLSHNPAPLSSKVGMKLLSQNPAPFSSLFKLKLLTSRRK